MNREIGDYLKYYLDTNVECRADNGAWKEVTVPIGMAYIHQERYDGIKPILRPISDMTEEEAIEVAKLSEWEPHFRDVKVERTKYNDLVVTWQGANESRDKFNATGDVFYCYEQFHYLLSKGFDMFQLIDEGLAINTEIIHP
jgi:hypothetical protein